MGGQCGTGEVIFGVWLSGEVGWGGSTRLPVWAPMDRVYDYVCT